jgi:tetratricopeptide (TPR) repeat protein
LPQSQAANERFIKLSLALHNSLSQLGEFRQALEQSLAAQAIAERIDDQHRLGLSLSAISNCHILMGEPRRAAETGLRALSIAEASSDIRSKIIATAVLGQSYYGLGDYRRVVHLFAPLAKYYTGEREHDTFGMIYPMAIWSRVFLSSSLARLGRFPESMIYADEAVRMVEALAQPPSLSLAYWMCADARLQRGESESALAAAERAYEISFRLNLPLTLIGPSGLSALAYARTGRATQALTRLAQLEVFTERAAAQGMFLAVSLLHLGAEAYLLLDRPDDAQRLAARAAEFSRKHGTQGYEAEARQVLAQVAMLRTDFSEAGAQFAEALRIAEELGMRPLIAHCLAGLGRLCLRKGEREQVRTHLTTAAAMYREMEMHYWLRPVEFELMQMT